MNVTESLHKWIHTFKLNSNYDTPQDLCDGVAMAHALTQISPEFFTNDWMSKIREDAGNTWRLRVSNLRKIEQRIRDFYSEVLEQSINEKLIPDVNAIGRDNNLEQLGLLLQLILGCAVSCDHKEHFIGTMLSLEEDVQSGLKTAIQEIFKDSGNSLDTQPSMVNEPRNELSQQLEDAIRAKDVLSQKCHELETKFTKLETEKMYLMQEIDRLTDVIRKNHDRYEHSDNVMSSGVNEEIMQKLHHNIERLNNELFKMEESKEEYREKCEYLHEEISKLRNSNEHLQNKIAENKHLMDELDSLRHLYDEMERLKAINDRQREKIEESQDIKRQLRLSEEKNTSLMKHKLELEEEIKRISSLKSQLDMNKKLINELRQNMGEETHRADKYKYEYNRINDKYLEISQEKEKLQTQLNTLRITINQSNRNDHHQSIDVDGSIIPDSPILEEMIKNPLQIHTVPVRSDAIQASGDTNEKLMRLEYENEILKQRINNADNERSKLIESQLEDERARVIDLEAKNRLINQRIIQLEGQIIDMQSKDERPQSDIKSNDQINAMEEIIRQKDSVIDAIKNELHDSEQKISSLKSVLSKKEDEIAETAIRYKKYVEIARESVHSLEQVITDPSGNDINSPGGSVNNLPIDDVNQYKFIMQQKEKQIDELLREHEKANQLRDVEERFMTIAFHNMCAHLQRKAAEERIRSGSNNITPPSASFLSRQRQVSTRRFNMSGVPQSEFFD